MDIRPLVEADAAAFAALCKHDFPYFRDLEDYRTPHAAAQHLLTYEAYPKYGIFYGVFDPATQLQGVIRADKTEERATWEVAVAKSPEAPMGISITTGLSWVMNVLRAERKVRTFTAEVHHANLPSRNMLARLRFTEMGRQDRVLLYRRYV